MITKVKLIASVLRFCLAVYSAATLMGCGDAAPRIVQPAWSGAGQILIFDHHTHTRFSDGALDLGSVVDKAAEEGCNALVISDHSDTVGTASVAYFDALDVARLAHPQVMIFGGMELEMPSYGGREHLGLLVEPTRERQILPVLKDRLSSGAGSGASNDYAADLAALSVIEQAVAAGSLLHLVYNHPSRRDPSPTENQRDFLAWSQETSALRSIAGAPGHQKASEPGDYTPPLLTKGRWDPMVSELGGGLDQLLSQGFQLWGSMAGSDYHNDKLDQSPCGFSRTYVTVPEPTYVGVLQALKAGTYWGVHGQLLDQLSVKVELEGALVEIRPGAEVYSDIDEGFALMHIEISRGAGGRASPLLAEVIGNCVTGEVEVLGRVDFDVSSNSEAVFVPLHAIGADDASCFVRVRISDASSRLFAYTNHIRFHLNGG